MSIEIDLEGRVFLQCGASPGGISGATARKLAATGCSIVCVDISQDLLDQTIADVEAKGGRCYGIVADLLDPMQTDPIVDTIIREYGRLDGVANIAGGTRQAEWMPLELTPLEEFRTTLNYNLEYVFRICRDAARSMIERKAPGSIVNVGSISALTSAPWHGPYGAAKSGLSALTRTMANEWREYGIRANTVSPGAVYTQRIKDMQAARGSAGGDVSGVIWTTPDDLANMIIFLLSDLASGVSGQTIVVDSSLSTKFCGGDRK